MKLTDGLFWYEESALFRDCNKYVVEGDFLILIDTGNQLAMKKFLKELRGDGLEVSDLKVVINTHCHPDHCGADNVIRKLTGAKIILHPAELERLEEYRVIGELLGIDQWEPSFESEWEDEVSNGEATMKILHTPGHSTGSISVYCPLKRFLACGDLLFSRGVGRVDLPGGDGLKLRKSIERVSKLPLDYLLPGHGEVLVGADNISKNFEFVKSNFF